MKKATRLIISIVLVIAILGCCAWYLFFYDRDFTADLLLNCARFCASNGNYKLSAWFYNHAYSQSDDSDAVAIELARQYIDNGNYTKAENTLSNAIENGGGAEVYIALSRAFVAQDKIRDAVLLLDGITDESVKAQLESTRPAAPVATPDADYYNQYISVTLTAEDNEIYAALDSDYPSTANDLYSDPIPLAAGENSLCAVAVDENGLVSTRARYGYTIGDVVEVVTFSDPIIEQYVRTTLNVAESTVLYTNDLWVIKDLVVPAEASSYADLQYMIYLESVSFEKAIPQELAVISELTNLKTLKITDAAVTEDVLNAIGLLPNLKDLELSNCSLSSIAPLSNTTGLERFVLAGNTVRNLDAVSNMPNLAYLDLQHNAVNDLSPLSDLEQLTFLNVSHNALQTISPIYEIANLQHLDASFNDLSAIGGIDALVELQYLALSGNKLTNISKVSACTKLTELYVDDNLLTDISTLNSLNKLMFFDFSHNQVTELPAFSKDCALVNLNGSHNLIETLAPLEGLANLNYVNLDYNEKISSVAELANCPLLVEVNVYATYVTDVTMLTNQSIIVNYNPVQNPGETEETTES